jgi:AcrR family transcriptional regulator
MKTARKRDRDRTARDLKAGLLHLLQSMEKVSIGAVARKAGVTPALIHNKYPDVAEEIRRATGRSTRAQYYEKHQLLVAERGRNRELRAERDALLQEVRDLASENEALRREFVIQRAMAAGTAALLPARPAR